jgi:hypothetical protein
MTEETSIDDEEVKRILEESLKNGDFGLLRSVEGECVRCGEEAVWCSPISGDCYCEQHAKEFFTERHG